LTERGIEPIGAEGAPRSVHTERRVVSIITEPVNQGELKPVVVASNDQTLPAALPPAPPSSARKDVRSAEAPFLPSTDEDKPLRRELRGPQQGSAIRVREPRRVLVPQRSTSHPTARSDSGESLNTEWNVGARHALYHKDGTFYMPLERFPGAYFDADGYVLFRTEREYVSSPYLSIGERVNVRRGISHIPGYKKMR
jgi:hypothetical protein